MKPGTPNHPLRRSLWCLTLIAVVTVTLATSEASAFQPRQLTDDYGYTAINYDSLTSFAVNSSQSTPLVSDTDDDGEIEKALPWEFHFYGRRFDRVIVSADGFVTLVPTSSWGSNLGPLPGNFSIPGTYVNTTDTIAVFWDDLDPIMDPSVGSVGKFTIQEFGDASDGRVTFTWSDFAFYSDPSVFLTFSLSLYTDGTIVKNYESLPATYLGGGGSATIGLDDDARDRGLQFSYNEPGVVESGTSIVYYPPGSSRPDANATPRPTATAPPTVQPTSTPGSQGAVNFEVLDVRRFGDVRENLTEQGSQVYLRLTDAVNGSAVTLDDPQFEITYRNNAPGTAPLPPQTVTAERIDPLSANPLRPMFEIHLDTSGSMAGQPIEDLKRGLIDAFSERDCLPPIDIRSLVPTIGHRHETEGAFFRRDSSTLNLAIKDLLVGGEVDLYGPLCKAITRKWPSQGSRSIILVTESDHFHTCLDCECGDPGELLQSLIASNIKVSVVAIGQQVDTNPLLDIATASGGTLVSVPAAFDAVAAIESLMDTMTPTHKITAAPVPFSLQMSPGGASVVVDRVPTLEGRFLSTHMSQATGSVDFLEGEALVEHIWDGPVHAASQVSIAFGDSDGGTVIAELWDWSTASSHRPSFLESQPMRITCAGRYTFGFEPMASHVSPSDFDTVVLRHVGGGTVSVKVASAGPGSFLKRGRIAELYSGGDVRGIQALPQKANLMATLASHRTNSNSFLEWIPVAPQPSNQAAPLYPAGYSYTDNGYPSYEPIWYDVTPVPPACTEVIDNRVIAVACTPTPDACYENIGPPSGFVPGARVTCPPVSPTPEPTCFQIDPSVSGAYVYVTCTPTPTPTPGYGLTDRLNLPGSSLAYGALGKVYEPTHAPSQGCRVNIGGPSGVPHYITCTPTPTPFGQPTPTPLWAEMVQPPYVENFDGVESAFRIDGAWDAISGKHGYPSNLEGAPLDAFNGVRYLGTFPGIAYDHETHREHWAYSPVFDFVRHDNIRVSFRSWLSVDVFERVALEVSTDDWITSQVVWSVQNQYIRDAFWVHHAYDVAVGGVSGVQFRFVFENAGGVGLGAHVDDFRVDGEYVGVETPTPTSAPDPPSPTPSPRTSNCVVYRNGVPIPATCTPTPAHCWLAHPSGLAIPVTCTPTPNGNTPLPTMTTRLTSTPVATSTPTAVPTVPTATPVGPTPTPVPTDCTTTIVVSGIPQQATCTPTPVATPTGCYEIISGIAVPCTPTPRPTPLPRMNVGLLSRPVRSGDVYELKVRIQNDYNRKVASFYVALEVNGAFYFLSDLAPVLSPDPVPLVDASAFGNFLPAMDVPPVSIFSSPLTFSVSQPTVAAIWYAAFLDPNTLAPASSVAVAPVILLP